MLRAEEERLVREGLDVVDFVAYRLARRLGGRVAFEDLRSTGREALVDAARTYDATRAQFKTYAARRIQWAILDGFRRETHGRTMAVRARALAASQRFTEGFASEVPESELPTEEAYQARLRTMLAGQAAALAIGLVAPVADLSGVADDAEDAEEQLVQAELVSAMRRAVAELPARERALVERHYFGDEQFDVIAAELGISKSRASRIHTQAILRLAKALGAPKR